MSKPFFIAETTRKPSRTGEPIDVAARHFVYKLFEATNGQPGVWQALKELREAKATVARAVKGGWVVVRQDEGRKTKVQTGSLTDEGRRVGRKGLRG